MIYCFGNYERSSWYGTHLLCRMLQHFTSHLLLSGAVVTQVEDHALTLLLAGELPEHLLCRLGLLGIHQ